MKYLLKIALVCFAATTSQMACAGDESVVRYETLPPAQMELIRQSCSGRDCANKNAIFFIHGVYGSAESFKNGNFDWRKEMPDQIKGQGIDIYSITYTTNIEAWLKKDIATLDEVVYQIFNGLYGWTDGRQRSFIDDHPYRSIGFIAHSLGGNVITALVHTVKSEMGHEEKARMAFAITLGTPVRGAHIADVGSWLKDKLRIRDPLLKSLQHDNTFLRMLAHWKYSEEGKANRFGCRPFHVYAAYEGRRVRGAPIVRVEDALPIIGQPTESELFPTLNHLEISRPSGRQHGVYTWVLDMLDKEYESQDLWHQRNPGEFLCSKIRTLVTPQ